jgi:ParB family chromosome partitioning protein
MADLARECVDETWSVRGLEAEVQRSRPAGKTKPAVARPRDAHERMLEEELQQIFGTAVRIKRGREIKGKVEIPFYNVDDFERIFELLAGRPATEVVS